MRLIDADAYQFPGDLENEPTIDAVPVVHGRWERNIVIKCGLKHHEGFNASCCNRWSKYRTNYCPNCGAKMDGGNDG